jgi:hypothetical protein
VRRSGRWTRTAPRPAASVGMVVSTLCGSRPLSRCCRQTTDRPLTARAGAIPVWSEEEIGAVIEFLQTLTDRDAATAADGP